MKPSVSRVCCYAFLVAATIAAYWQVSANQFVVYDDPMYLTENRHVCSEPLREAIRWAVTTTWASNWHPLTWMSHMADCRLYGLRPAGHHWTNVALHALNAVLLLMVLARSTGAFWRSAAVAALFALHPLQVESVAWAAQRKTVLSGTFWMLSLWTYVSYAKAPRVSAYLLLLLVFILGVMSKPAVVTLPFALLLLDYWPLGRVVSANRAGEGPRRARLIASMGRLLLEKVPLILIALGACWATIVAQGRGQAMMSLTESPFPLRVENALVSYLRYIGKLIWPMDLSVFYPYPSHGLPGWMVVSAALFLICFSILAVKMARDRPYLAVGWFWYVGMLVPMLGLVQVGAQSWADRYAYLPLIGLGMMLSWGVADATRTWPHRTVPLALSGGVAIALMMGATWERTRVWRDSLTLFENAAKAVGPSALVQNNLGAALAAQGKLDEAFARYQEALRIDPGNELAHYNLAEILAYRREYDAAATHYRAGLRANPRNALAHLNFGNVLARQGQLNAAVTEYREALRLGPEDAQGHINLGNILARQGRMKEAIEQYRAGLKRSPGNRRARANLAGLLTHQRRFEEAIAEYLELLKERPGDFEARNGAGIVLSATGRFEEAELHFREALRIRPDAAEAHCNLGSVLAARGNPGEAMREYREALRIRPDHPEARHNLALLERRARPGAGKN